MVQLWALGSLLSATVCTLVLKDLTEKQSKHFQGRIPFFKKYIDDCFTLGKKDKIIEVQNALNDFFQRIKFTNEIEKNEILNFFDITLI